MKTQLKWKLIAEAPHDGTWVETGDDLGNRIVSNGKSRFTHRWENADGHYISPSHYLPTPTPPTPTPRVELFPIQGSYRREARGYFTHPGIPWDVIRPHEKQAMANHGNQSLERLAQRGGLGFCEAVAVLEDRPWHEMETQAAIARLNEILARKREGEWEVKARVLERECAGLRAALKPFAEVFDGDLNQVGGGTLVAPMLKAQLFKDAKRAREVACAIPAKVYEEIEGRKKETLNGMFGQNEPVNMNFQITPSPASSTSPGPSAEINQLVQDWNEAAKIRERNGITPDYSRALRSCAEQLAAAIASAMWKEER